MKNVSFLIVITALFISSCTSLQVTVDADKQADFTKYKTFEYYGWAEESDKILNRFDKERIESAFGKEFKERGLDLVEENGDLIVTLYIVTETKTKKTANTTNYAGYGGYGGYYGYGPGWRWGGGHSTTTVSEYDYEVGTLVCDVYDKAEEKLIWEGVATGTVDDNPQTREKTTPRVIARLMRDFPIQPRGK